MTTLNARNLFLDDVHRILGFQKQYNCSFTPLLTLENLTEFEQRELVQIRNDFDNYLTIGKVSEGQVKLLVVGPLLRLAGFYRSPIQISVEEDIADIDITDEDTKITGRMDILAVNKAQQTTANIYFWILVIETKNSLADVLAGLPQLLTYAFKSLEHQTSAWGLVTNGARYQFVYLQPGNPPTYQLMPLLNLMESEPSIQIIQVLKAICKLRNTL
jgi:hypothetical protein